MRKVMKNKRGDVPVTILVLGVFAICALAILSFTYSAIKTNSSFESISVMENVNIKIENNSLSKYSGEIVKTRFRPSLNSKWLQDEVVFSVDYFGG